MPYDNIPGVRASYLDGAFAIPNSSSQPNILLVGPAISGRTNERFNITAISAAEKEFGAAAVVLRQAHEALAQGADNLSVIRSGGTQGSWVFTDSLGATLTVTPEYRDDLILDRYTVIIENDAAVNRFLVFDLIAQEWVYDSDEILVLDTGLVEVVDTGIDLFTLGDKATPALGITLTLIATGDFTVDGTATATSAVGTAGDDGTAVSLAERYAALNSTYHMLDFKDADIVLPADVYLDDLSLADVVPNTYGSYWKGTPATGSGNDYLGWAWQYVYRGKLYTYMADTVDYASVAQVAATLAANTDLTLTAAVTGKGGNAITYEQDITGAPSLGVTITETDFGFGILVVGSAGDDSDAIKIAVDAALAAKTLTTGVLASTLLTVTGTGATAMGDEGPSNLSGGTGGAALTHAVLTGDTVPAAVTTKWAAVVDAELREVNFGHQLASFCETASVTWSTMLGVISFKAPTGFSRTVIADWVGEAPTLTDQGTYKYIDAPADNGTAILGFKFLAGESKTSDGYRSALVVDGNTTDGYAGGGFIRTVGSALPNGSKWTYGVDDADEALDSGGKPVDIGKHLFCTYDWPVHNTGFNGGTTYRGSIPAMFAGKIATLPENEEPIGLNGSVSRVQNLPRIHSSQLSDLAGQRTIGLRREDGFGLIITSAKTSANPDSDYTRLSTIRAVNRVLTGIRRIAKPYVGKEFSTQRLISLQAAIDGLIVAERSAKIHGGAKARIEFTREDRIMGRLTIKLRMVPPFSIDTITVETSLAADESEL